MCVFVLLGFSFYDAFCDVIEELRTFVSKTRMRALAIVVCGKMTSRKGYSCCSQVSVSRTLKVRQFLVSYPSVLSTELSPC